MPRDPQGAETRVIAGWQADEVRHGDIEVWYYAMCEDGSVWGRPAWDASRPWERQAPPIETTTTITREPIAPHAGEETKG